MNFHKYFSTLTRPVQACVVGSGGFGRSFLAQCLRTPLLTCRVAVDLDHEIVVDTLRSVGIAHEQIRVCESPEAALSAWSNGFYIATSDLKHVAGLPLDIVVEATGNPEAGARHSKIALESGFHLALVSKEVDSVIGSGLARMGKEKGLVVTPVDGDQPSLLIGLITWAQVLGLEIISAGKASEYDFVFNPDTGQMTSNGVIVDVPGFEELWSLDGGNAADLVARRSQMCARLPQRAVPDFCEMLLVANATGMSPDQAEFHVPILRINEVPDVLRPLDDGGILHKAGTLELFHCLRKPDELSFAGGVFIVVRCHDAPTWALLAQKGHVVSADHKTALLYIPRHLLGLEAASSVLEAAGLGVSSGAAEPKPNLDLVGKACEFLPKGTVLAMGGHHHSIDNVAPVLVSANPMANESPAPFYLIANRALRRDVDAGQLICLADVDVDPASTLFQLRSYQDAVFFSEQFRLCPDEATS